MLKSTESVSFQKELFVIIVDLPICNHFYEWTHEMFIYDMNYLNIELADIRSVVAGHSDIIEATITICLLLILSAFYKL